MKIQHLILLLAALASATSAAAQRVEVLPLAGLYRPIQSLPGVRDGEQRLGSRIDNAIVAGVAGEARLIGPFSARATVLRASPDLLVYDSTGPRRAPARVTILAADLIVTGPRIAFVQPYLLLGTGTKHYAFSAAALGGAAAAEYADDRRDGVGHAGGGLKANLGRIGASVEMSNYSSVFGSASEPGPGEPDASAERQHDLVYTVGLRVRVF